MRNIALLIFTLFLSLSAYSQSDYAAHIKAEKQANQGIELLNQRKFAEAYPLLSEAWQFYNKNQRLYAVDYANLAHTIGQYFMLIGAYDKAEEYYGIAIPILQSVDVNDYTYRSTLTDAAWLYYKLHNWDKANMLYANAKYLYEKNLDLGTKYASLLSNYAILQSEMGNTLWAKMFVDMAKDIYMNADNVDKNEMSIILDNVSSVYDRLGFWEDATSTMYKALELNSESDIKEGRGEMLNNMGAIYFGQKKYREAFKYFKEAYDWDHSANAVIGSGMNLAWTQYMLNDKECLKTSQTLSDSIISDVMGKFAYLSNEERELYWLYNNIRLSMVNAIFANANNGSHMGAIYNNSLFAKGLLLKTSNQIKRDILASGDSNSKRLLEVMTFLEKELNRSDNTPGRVEQIRDSINIIDKQLTKANASYLNFKSELTPDWTRIKRSLAKDEAAIEFVQIPIIEKDSIPEPFEYRYYGLVVRNNSESPVLVPLCTDEELQELLENKSRIKLDRFIKNLYTTGNSKLYSGERLYKSIWSSLEKELDGVKTIYYSPVGQLNSISFNALMSDSTTLSERYSLHLLSSTAEVSQIKNNSRSKISDAVVYGGIVYDLSDDQMMAEARGYDTLSTRIAIPFEFDKDRSGWKYLSGTEDEARSINMTLDSIGVHTALFMGAHANEESIKALSGKSPYLLHIATHGFFLSDPKQIAVNPFMQNQERNGASNLLHRSGLLFAGANKTWVNGERVKGTEDGILSAEEISKLDLSSTEIVTLSACETGLGEIVSTEGVFGLQRAFKLSGVKTLIMSLWKVPDAATSKLMISFYKNWSSGMEIHQAFLTAQQKIKEEFSSPYYWAGFVMLD